MPTSTVAMDITNLVHHNREQAFALGDYASYHKQCGRQVAALRRRLGIATPKNRKYEKRGPLSSDDILKDTRYELPLY